VPLPRNYLPVVRQLQQSVTSAAPAQVQGVRIVDRKALLRLVVRRGDALHARAAAVGRLFRCVCALCVRGYIVCVHTGSTRCGVAHRPSATRRV
jgi:hypothetical protein